MGLGSTMAETKLSDIIEQKNKVNTDAKKTKANAIMVRYISKDYHDYIPTVGMIHRETNIPYIILENPDNLGVILIDRSLLYNKMDGTECVDVIEGQPFTVNWKEDINADVKQIMIANPKITQWTIPVSVGNVPAGEYTVDMIDPITREIAKVPVTQKFLYQMSFVKLFEAMFKAKSDGIIIGAIIGALLGIIGGFLLKSYMG
jgi:hypothetical protein